MTKNSGTTPHQTEQFRSLCQLSARVGSDPLLVQGAGGNTSLKVDGVLWIKASGTWLQNAKDSDLFVPVHIDPLLQAVKDGDSRAEKAVDFVEQSLNPSGLRPSIETTVHASLAQTVVVHVHCVNTIALAIRSDGKEQLAQRLKGFDWCWVPYARPGLPLAHMIARHKPGKCDVMVLGNHGLVVAADTVEAADALLSKVIEAVEAPERTPQVAQTDALTAHARGSVYQLPDNNRVHAVACDPTALCAAKGGSLYPDHVIFLGEGSVIAGPGESANDVNTRLASSPENAPRSIIFPGLGVLMHQDTSPGQDALALCLSDVCIRLGANAALNYLTSAENHELLNWEAEQYRQQLEKESAKTS